MTCSAPRSAHCCTSRPLEFNGRGCCSPVRAGRPRRQNLPCRWVVHRSRIQLVWTTPRRANSPLIEVASSRAAPERGRPAARAGEVRAPPRQERPCSGWPPRASRPAGPASVSIRTDRLWSTSGLTRPTVLAGHTDVVTSVAFSPDRRQLASTSYDRSPRPPAGRDRAKCPRRRRRLAVPPSRPPRRRRRAACAARRRPRRAPAGGRLPRTHCSDPGAAHRAGRSGTGGAPAQIDSTPLDVRSAGCRTPSSVEQDVPRNAPSGR